MPLGSMPVEEGREREGSSNGPRERSRCNVQLQPWLTTLGALEQGQPFRIIPSWAMWSSTAELIPEEADSWRLSQASTPEAAAIIFSLMGIWVAHYTPKRQPWSHKIRTAYLAETATSTRKLSSLRHEEQKRIAFKLIWKYHRDKGG